MSIRLPEFIDPVQLADKRGIVQGELAVKDLTRLVEMLNEPSGTVVVDLYFSRDGRLAVITGTINTTLQLQCQNCLSAVPWTTQSEVRLAVVNAMEQVERLGAEYEPLFLTEEKIALKEIIEEELLLLIPTYPKHDFACFTSYIESNTNEFVVKENKPTNPFSILATLHTSEKVNGSTKE